jgi:ABC-type multidrug transport system fused ATPase/permease subunit
LSHSFIFKKTNFYQDRLGTNIGKTPPKRPFFLREYFDFHQVGELQESLNRDTELIARMAVAQPKLILSHITRIVTNSALLVMVSGKLAVRALCIPLPICGLVIALTMMSTRKQNRKVNRANDGAAATTIEKLRELSTVRQFGMERYEVSSYCETATWRMQLERRLKVTADVALFISIQAFVFARLLNIYWGVSFVLAGELQADRLLMAVINLENAVASVRMLFSQLPQMFLVIDPLERLAFLLESTPKIEPPPDSYSLKDASQLQIGLRPKKIEGRFSFQDVHFAYPTEKQKRVLNGISFDVQPGQKVALVGSAGCGKSTCMQLVQRFYDTVQGHVLLDDQPIKDYDLHYLRAHIGIVAQDNVLFTASIYDNITYGMGHSGLPEATEEMVKAACDAANATEFIMEFPNRFATMVGDSGGIKLSGGQKQRIAIARAIIRSPPILLLDEATSALDSVNEKQVQAALDKMLKMHSGALLHWHLPQ